MFRVRTFEARPLAWWYEQRDLIDMNPPYQRSGGAWSPAQRSFLIDSILNDFDLPKFYLADFTYGPSPLNTQKKQYSVIDGRQRLEAIFGFFSDELSLPKWFQLRDDPETLIGEITYSELKRLHPRVATKFDIFNPSIMSVFTDDPTLINELFVRLNSSRALTGAEVRNAFPGEVPEIIRGLAAHRFFSECVRFSRRGGQDRNAAAKLLLTEVSGGLTDVKRAQLDRLASQSEASIEVVAEAARTVRMVLEDLANVFSPRDALLSSQGPITLYYWLAREHPQAIGALRSFLETFEGIRRGVLNAHGTEPSLPGMREYQALSRSINDRFSLMPMYRFLELSFSAYLADGEDGVLRVASNY